MLDVKGQYGEDLLDRHLDFDFRAIMPLQEKGEGRPDDQGSERKVLR